MNKKKLTSSLIIPTLERHDKLESLLFNISNQTVLPDEIIIIEQGDTKINENKIPLNIIDIVEIVKVKFKSLAKARNLGLQLSSKDIIIYFDDDIKISDDYIKYALWYMDCNQCENGIGGCYEDIPKTKKSKLKIYIGRLLKIYSDGRENRILNSGWADFVRNKYAEKISKAEWLFGCNMVYRRKALESIEIPTDMEKWSFLEDVFIGNRITSKFGRTMSIHPKLKVFHSSDISSGTPSKSVLRMRILYRYMLWKEVDTNCNNINIIDFVLGMIANFLLDCSNYRIKYCISEYIKIINYIRKNDINFEVANQYAFIKD